MRSTIEFQSVDCVLSGLIGSIINLLVELRSSGPLQTLVWMGVVWVGCSGFSVLARLVRGSLKLAGVGEDFYQVGVRGVLTGTFPVSPLSLSFSKFQEIAVRTFSTFRTLKFRVHQIQKQSHYKCSK